MNDPARLHDCGSNEVRALLREARPPRPIEAAQRARGEARISRLAAASTAVGLVFVLKGLAWGAGLGALAVAGVVTVETLTVPKPSLAPTTPAASVAGVAPAVSRKAPDETASSPSPPAPMPVPDLPSPSARVVESALPAEIPSAPAPAEDLAAEVALLERARQAIGADPTAALALTQEHARRFAHGQLGLEREMVAIEALQRLGRSSEARARADSLLRSAPESTYARRIRDMFPEER